MIITVIRGLFSPQNEQFEDIYAQYQKVVYAATRYYASDPVTQQDLFQEVWLAVYQKLDGFESRSKLSTWIYSIARNITLNHQRKVSRFPVNTEEKPRESSASFEEAKLNSMDITRAMQQLTDHEQSLIFSKYSCEYSYDELAEMFELPVAKVKSRLFEARKKMRSFLEK
jgi:RNA polymerase sigma-70 factor (ECF subfamily)